MDPASTVYHLTVSIVNFIAEHGDKDALYEQISNIVIQIRHVINPLVMREITDEPLKQVLQSLQNVLSSVEGHLRSWKESRTRKMIALVNPWAMTQEIKEDRVQLMDQYILLMGAIQVVDYIRGYNLLFCDGRTGSAQPSPQELDQVKKKEPDVLEFWHSRIGSDLEVIKSQELCDHLSAWLGKKLRNTPRKRLLLRLDEHDTGYVTLKTLQDLVRDESLKEVINIYSSEPKFPLLVWISDDLALNAPKVAYARSQGVNVVQLASTSTAKAWIKVNQGLLKKQDTPSSLRFISDQWRLEFNSSNPSTSTPTWNGKAGNQITKIIRTELGFQAPILIFTNKKSMNRTRYVQKYQMVGSISGNRKIYRDFVRSLGERRGDDTAWVGFPDAAASTSKG